MEHLIRKYRELLQNTDTRFVRYLEPRIEWDARLIAILGARGVGKTTMLLQHIKLYDDTSTSLYVTADDLYFSRHTLVELAETFYHNGGTRLYIDEIHRYDNWSVEIKNIYDSLPRLSVVYTGSSILELEKGGADLSRRKLQYTLAGLSFREYLEFGFDIHVPVATLDDVLRGVVYLPNEYRPLSYFHQYLREGYYPFFKEKVYLARLNAVINTTLETDIPTFANYSIATAQKLKQLMYIIAQSLPFKPNITKIAKDINISRNELNNIFAYLEKAGMIGRLRSEVQGISGLGKTEKVYLDNTNMAYALSDTTPDTGNLRETFFYALTRVTHTPLSSLRSDFTIDKYTFEVGGKNKGKKQISGMQDAYIVKDDIEIAGLHTIPLWTFGMMY